MHYFYLHGFASGPSSAKAQFFAAKFAEIGHTLTIFDLNLAELSQPTLTKQLAYLEQKLATCDEVILIASSLGGLASLILAENNLAIVKLILLAPALEIKRLWPLAVGKEAIQKWAESGSIPVYNRHFQREIALNYDFVRDLAHHSDHDFSRQIASLIFHGKDDLTIPLEVSRRYCLTNPKACLYELTSDHGLLNSLEFIWQQCQAFITDS